MFAFQAIGVEKIPFAVVVQRGFLSN